MNNGKPLLLGFNPSTGKQVVSQALAATPQPFAAPASGAGHVFVPVGSRVEAFAYVSGTTSAVRVNAGGPAYTGGDGRAWQADNGFSASATASTSAGLGGTADAPLYQNVRYGKTFNYTLNTANGNYNVVLKFAEIYWSNPGQRIFNVAINGQAVLTNFDILASVPRNTALDKTFATSVTNGTLTIAFTTVTDNANVNAIEILPSSGPPPPASAVRLNAGGPAYTGGDGRAWHADMGFTGGTTASTTATISGTSHQTLYKTVRYGKTFNYAFFLPNGNYTVVLKFAEIYWTSPGMRVFNVAINGQTVLSNFDILAQPGVSPDQALDKTFTTTLTNGLLTVSLTTVRDNANISALEITPGP